MGAACPTCELSFLKGRGRRGPRGLGRRASPSALGARGRGGGGGGREMTSDICVFHSTGVAVCACSSMCGRLIALVYRFL